MAVVTAAEYKVFKGISATTYDAQLAVIIPAAQKLAEDYCDVAFDSATFTEYLDGNDWTRICVKNPPIQSITSIASVFADGTSSTIDSTTYTYDAESGVVGFNPSNEGFRTYDNWGEADSGTATTAPWLSTPNFRKGFHNIKIIYVGGYGTYPASLKYAMYMLVDAMLSQALQTPGSAGVYTSERLGDYSYTRGEVDGTSKLVETLFYQWRRVVA